MTGSTAETTPRSGGPGDPSPSWWRRYVFDGAKINHHYFEAERTVSMLILYGVFLALFIAMVGLTPVGRLLGLSPWTSLTLVLMNYLQQVGIVLWCRMWGLSRRGSTYFEICSFHINLFIIAAFIVVGDKPFTPLWAFYLFYICILVNAFSFQPYLVVMVTLAGLAPGIVFWLKGEAGAPHFYYVSIFTLLGLWQYFFLSKQVERTQGLKDRTYRLEQARWLSEEKLRIAWGLHDGVGHQLAGAILGGHTAHRLISAIPPDYHQLRLVLADLQGRLHLTLGEVRQALWSLNLTSTSLFEVMAYLQRFFGDVGQASGVEINFYSEGQCTLKMAHPSWNDLHLSPRQKFNLFRFLQETMTDVIRNAPGQALRVNLTLEETTLQVAVQLRGASGRPKREDEGSRELRHLTPLVLSLSRERSPLKPVRSH